MSNDNAAITQDHVRKERRARHDIIQSIDFTGSGSRQ
jgi:hypothetical protein